MVKVTTAEVLQLPVPGQPLNANNEIAIEDFVISSKCTIPILQARLRAYGLPVSGTKPTLIETLRKFAHDRSEWSTMFESRKNGKRGAITGTRVKKASSQRILAQFGDQPAQSGYASVKSADRAPQMLEERRIADNDAWAKNVLARKQPETEVNPETSIAAGTSMLTSETDTSSLNLESNMMDVDELEHEGALARIQLRKLERRISSFTTDISTRFARLEGAVLQTVSSRDSGVMPQAQPLPATLTVRDQHKTIRSASVSVPTTPFNPPMPSMTLTHGRSIPASEIFPGHLVILKLGDEELAVDQTAVPDPPAITFSQDLSVLFTEWHCSDRLVVNGRVEERERYESDAAFWDIYSANGTRLDYTTILLRLADSRAKQAEQDVKDALQFFDNDLSCHNAGGAFTYKKKGGVTVLLSKPTDISKNWRAYLTNNPDAALAWRSMQDPAESTARTPI
ncbi:hypothetical protein HWV62_44683 [Athelia sp. TMB]|nr:hypothetical protein HWV62_44683 [Athelia sp. TMB]